MKLEWRPVAIGDGPPISTSLTKAEAQELRRLAKGKKVLEVGSAYGYSTVNLAQVAAEVTSVDPHQALDSLNVFWGNLVTYGVSEKVNPVVTSSNALLPGLDNEHWDMVFVDGDHSDPAARFDIEQAKRLVGPGGVVAVHDYGEDTCTAVAPVCDELLPGGRLAVDTLWVWVKPEAKTKE